MKKKVVFVLPYIADYRYDFFEELVNTAAYKYDFKFVYGTKPSTKLIAQNKKKVEKGINELEIPTKYISLGKMDIQFIPKLKRYVLEEKPDIVLIMFHLGIVNHWILLLKLKSRNIPFVLWGAAYYRVDLSNIINGAKEKLYRQFFRLSSGFICFSESRAASLIQEGYTKEKIFFAQNSTKFKRDLKDKAIQKKSAKNRVFTFLFVGAIIKNKNLESLFNAVKILVDRRHEFCLSVVGGGDPLASYSEYIKDLNLEEYVFLKGKKYGKDLEKEFLSSDVFILPGTGGLAVNDAMVYELPILSTVGDGTVRDLVIKNKNGFLFKNLNPTAIEIAEKMEVFLNMEKKLLKEFGENSFKIITSKATITGMVNSFITVTDKILIK